MTARNNPELIDACWHGDVEKVKKLLSENCNVNISDENGNTPLHCSVNNKEIIKLLIDHGADVNKPADNGWTPLNYAMYHSSKENIELLLCYGADVNKADNDGRTLLFSEVMIRRKEVAELLIKYGANVNKADNNGWTLLQCAIDNNNNKEMIELLITHGADVNKTDKNGKTPLDKAKEQYRYEIVKVLEYHTIIKPKLLFLTCLREFDDTSLFHDNYLPRDMFNVIAASMIQNY